MLALLFTEPVQAVLYHFWPSSELTNYLPELVLLYYELDDSLILL